MTYSREAQDRMKKIETLKNANIVPYANNYRWKQDIKDILELSKQEWVIKDLDVLMNEWVNNTFQTAGRIMLYRSHWKLAFAKIKDSTSEIQVCFLRDKFRFNTWMPKSNNQDDYKFIEANEAIDLDWFERNTFKIIEKYTDRWDYIWVKWDLFLTKHNELTLLVSEVQILSKAVRPLPEKFHWVVDQETIYRKRYLDLVTNDESYDRFVLKSKFIKALRDFYHKEWFTEITTPILWNSASGAAAQPFITHHNDFGEDVFLRIAPEVWLKMATAWRFEKVFEFWPDFRNEWSDPSHLQEFHVVEHYAAYWNFEDNIKFTEEMFDYFFNELNLERKIPVRDKKWNKKIVDFTTPFERIDYIEWVNTASWLDITKYNHWDEEKLIKDIEAKWISFEWMENMAVPTLIDYLYKKVLRPSITWPAFIYNYPKALQPLARQNDIDNNIVEQFQLVVNGWEINKAYSELVDPKIQSQNFNDQSGALELWDEEATQWDDEFITAMEYWMPCQSGWGMGFDRIFSILTQQDNLRDVILFPLMKEEKKEKKIDPSIKVIKELNKLAKDNFVKTSDKNLEKMENDEWENRFIVVLNKDIELWRIINATAHMSFWLASELRKEWLFLEYKDASWDIHPNISHYNTVVLKAEDSSSVYAVREKAKKLWVKFTDFIRTMTIWTSERQLSATANFKTEDLEYFGICMFWNSLDLKEVTEGLELF